MTKAAIEDIAQELCKIDLGKPHAEIDALIGAIVGDLDAATSRAALDRAAQIMRHQAAVADQEAANLERFFRLANSTGCPPDANKVTWLKERGLIEDAPGGYAFSAKASLYLIEHSK
jgi:hypothetical protein